MQKKIKRNSCPTSFLPPPPPPKKKLLKWLFWISEYLKENKYQFYVVPDLEVPFKVVLRWLLKSINSDKMREALNDKCYDIFQAIQMQSRKNGRMLPLFLLHLPRKDKSKMVFQTTSLLKIRIQIEEYIVSRKVV